MKQFGSHFPGISGGTPKDGKRKDADQTIKNSVKQLHTHTKELSWLPSIICFELFPHWQL